MKTERTRALEILQEAREILAQRLTERVLESAEEILSDARGDSYMSDIDGLYDQIGMRLAHVNQMISNLPPATESSAGTHTATVQTPHYSEEMLDLAPDLELEMSSSDSFSHEAAPALVGPLYVAAPALPAPKQEEPIDPAPVSFVTFVSQIRAGNVTSAGNVLAQLFGIEPRRGMQCAELFAERMERDSQFLSRAMQLRVEIQGEGYNGALALLYECFGLTGMESIAVLQQLRKRIAAE